MLRTPFVSRRQFLVGSSVLASALWLPASGFAATTGRKRLIFVMLRGGMDGLHAVVPYGDPNYAVNRGQIAVPAPGGTGTGLKLDAFFALHPSFAKLFQMYQAGEALFVHAVAPPYSQRSHFTAQDILENGTETRSTPDGWLGRALAVRDGGVTPTTVEAMSLGGAFTPLALGGAPSASAWGGLGIPAAASTFSALTNLYASDALLKQPLAMAKQLEAFGSLAPNGLWGSDIAAWPGAGTTAATLMNAANGPDVMMIELIGWDTHSMQGGATGNLAATFKTLDDTLGNIKTQLGSSWADTVVVVATEFGRTVKVNGTLGTDHGVGSVAFVLGGAVKGGRVVADWPGLASANLFEGRDLKATTDIRSVFKGVLRDHWGLSESAIETSVFPNSSAVPVLAGLTLSAASAGSGTTTPTPAPTSPPPPPPPPPPPTTPSGGGNGTTTPASPRSRKKKWFFGLF